MHRLGIGPGGLTAVLADGLEQNQTVDSPPTDSPFSFSGIRDGLYRLPPIYDDSGDGLLLGFYRFPHCPVFEKNRTLQAYIFFDQYRIIVAQMTSSIGLCLGAVLVISALVLAHPLSVSGWEFHLFGFLCFLAD